MALDKIDYRLLKDILIELRKSNELKKIEMKMNYYDTASNMHFEDFLNYCGYEE